MKSNSLQNLFHRKDFVRFWLGQSISLLGNWIHFAVLPLWVFSLTKSTVATGATFAFELLPVIIFSPIAGVLVDRFDRRRLLILTDTMSGITVLLMTLLVNTKSDIWILYLSVITLKIISTMTQPASASIIPDLVDINNLPAANSLRESIGGLTIALGPGIGAIIASQIGFKFTLLINALSFFVSALFTLSINLKSQKVKASEFSIFSSLVLGGKYLINSISLKKALTLEVIYFLIYGPSIALLFLYLPKEAGLSPELVGWTISSIGAGWFLGSLILAKWITLKSIRFVFLIGFGLIATNAIGMVFFALLSPYLPLVVGFFWGIENMFIVVASSTIYQQASDKAVRGRIFAFRRPIVNLAQLISITIATIASSIWSIGSILIISGILTTLIGLSCLGKSWKNLSEINEISL